MSNARMTKDQVRDLRLLVQRGVCVACAGKLLGLPVKYVTLWDAVNYRTWKHVK